LSVGKSWKKLVITGLGVMFLMKVLVLGVRRWQWCHEQLS
jgi:hypothetical protein